MAVVLELHSQGYPQDLELGTHGKLKGYIWS